MEDLCTAVDLNKSDDVVEGVPSKEMLDSNKSTKCETTLKLQLNDLPKTGDIKGNDVLPSSSIVSPHMTETRNIKRLDIGFSNITYTVKTGFFKKENKTILNGISGEFKSGELSAILGPSGAGKSTMLNILSGYTIFNIEGEITINGNLRDLKAFIPQSAYITQDTDLHPTLTVSEAMHFSASLKIGKNMSKSARRDRVKTILEAIGLYSTRHTRTGNLSGGQKKRLAIALELVNNPPVLILDEPTSGLDSSTSNQCISLLKKLAMDGRTIICTIHQPTAIAFGMFDHVYTVAEGECIYSGKSESVVPFLAEMYLNCPESYNPADYLLELATNDYGYQNFRLVEKIQNGKNISYRRNKETTAQIDAMNKVERMMEVGLLTPVAAPSMNNISLLATPNLAPVKELSSTLEISSNEPIPQSTINTPTKPKKPTIEFDAGKLCNSITIYATPFHEQLILLLYRTFLILWRDRSLSNLRIMIHVIMATFVGVLYWGIGNDASNTLNNFRYIFYSIMFLMYTAFSSMLVNFPLEFPIVSREHFNRWYSLRAYYVALTLADLPIQVLCTTLFILISYPMTAQPLEFLRISLFSIMVFLTAIVAQSIGLAVGSALSVKYGAIFGPFFICPFLTFSGFFLQLNDAPKYLHWLFHISFLKYGLEGSVLAIFGYDRPKMLCDKIYCHYTRPKVFIKDIGMSNASYQLALFALITTCLMLKTLAFYIMSFRLRLFR